MPQVSTLKDVWNRTKENWRNPSGGWHIWMRYHLLDLYSSLSQWITPFFIARMISDFICHLESVMSCDVKCKFKNEKYKSAACGAFVTNITFAAMVLPQKKFVVLKRDSSRNISNISTIIFIVAIPRTPVPGTRGVHSWFKTRPRDAGPSLVGEFKTCFVFYQNKNLFISLSGTVQGSGWDCTSDEVNTFDGWVILPIGLFDYSTKWASHVSSLQVQTTVCGTWCPPTVTGSKRR